MRRDRLGGMLQRDSGGHSTMKFHRRIALGAILLATLPAGSGLMADRLAPPPDAAPNGNPKVRWIRKTLTAPMPMVPTAPLPDPSALPTIDRLEAKSAIEPDLPPNERWTMAAKPGRQPARPQVLPTALGNPPAESGMTLEEVEKIALANNPTLVQASMRIQAAQGKCLQVGLYPNPTIGYRAEEMGADGTLGQQGAFFAQEFVTAGKLELRSAVAAHEIVKAERAWEAQVGRVLNDVRSAWYEVLVAQRIVDLNRQLVGIGQQGVKASGDLLAAMEVSRVDLLQARIEADSANIQLHEAQNRYQAAWTRLAALLGVPEMKPTRLAGDLESDLPKLRWEESLESLLADSPELGEARADIQRAQCVVQRECAERVPNVDVQASILYHHPDEDTVAGLEVGLPLPIFNRNQGNIYRAQAQLIDAEKEVQRVELALRDRLATAFRHYANARYEAKKYAEEILPNAKASLDLVQTGYRQGEYDYLTLLTAQRTYFQVNLAYLESLREYRSTRVVIEGSLLTGGLDGYKTAGKE